MQVFLADLPTLPKQQSLQVVQEGENDILTWDPPTGDYDSIVIQQCIVDTDSCTTHHTLRWHTSILSQKIWCLSNYHNSHHYTEHPYRLMRTHHTLRWPTSETGHKYKTMHHTHTHHYRHSTPATFKHWDTRWRWQRRWQKIDSKIKWSDGVGVISVGVISLTLHDKNGNAIIVIVSLY